MQNDNVKCQSCKQKFVVEPDDFAFYEKMAVPPPTWCPDCRAKRRMIFWNQNNLFRKKDTKTGEETFSTYPEEADIKIYEHDYWWSDDWDPIEYGMNVDFKKPFLEQLKDLNYKVPWASRSVHDGINSDYTNQASWLKDCYLCFNGNSSENCLYCVGFGELKDSIDLYACHELELCYEVTQSGQSFECFFCKELKDCRNVWLSIDCIDCQDCFGCVNLRHQKYQIFNEQYSEEEYKKKLKELKTGSYKALQKAQAKFKELYLKLPHRYYHGIRNENVVGDHVWYSKNAKYCYEAGGLEDSKYLQNMSGPVKDCYDFTNWGENSELIYEVVSVGRNNNNLKFCFDCWPAMQKSEYCLNCHSSSNLFGCVGLRSKEYYILNKSYSKEEYELLVEKIKKHMDSMPYKDAQGRVYKYGEFFPPEFSPLAYNETVAIDYFPATKVQVKKMGLMWRDLEEKEFKITITADELPDDIKDTKDSIIDEVIECNGCKKAYRVLDREYEFLKRFNIPLPRLCVKCRYDERMRARNPMKWIKRKCQCKGAKSENGVYVNQNKKHSFHHIDSPCPNEFETTYASDRKDIIYCEQCYQGEVI